MKTELMRLILKLENGQLLGQPLLVSSAIDGALAARDDPSFEDDWMRLHNRLTREFKTNEEITKLLKRVRELAFTSAYRFSQNPDLSGYVSDDFGLLGLGLATGLDDLWLNGLLAEYVAGRFPRGIIQSVSKPLTDQI